MTYFKTSVEWYEQSSLLLKARPTSTRIVSKYTALKPTPSKIKKRNQYAEKKAAKSTGTARASSPSPQLLKPDEVTVTFTLKTYDPESGTCLIYETTKGAEVGRLIGNLGRLGRHMAALPEVIEDLSAPAGGGSVSTPNAEATGDTIMGNTQADSKAAASTGGAGGGKKKKKGKK